jgi:hypothetical protein
VTVNYIEKATFMVAFLYFLPNFDMVTNLFSFYERLFTGEAWDEIMAEYRDGAQKNVSIKDGKTIETECYFSDDGEPYTFQQLERLFIRKQARKLFKDCTEFIQNLTSSASLDDASRQLTFLLDLYSERIREKYDSERYNIIATYDEAKADILKMLAFYLRTNTLPQNDSSPASKGNVQDVKMTKPKIKWLANTNVLITLFYDLLNGQEMADQLIEADKNYVKELLINNFLDSEGNPLSESTIATLFTPSKVEKRSKRGDRIELGNVKLKKQS